MVALLAVKWLLVTPSSVNEVVNLQSTNFVCLSGCLVLQAVAALIFEQGEENNLLRPGVHHGAYCVMLVPLAMLTETDAYLSVMGASRDYRKSRAVQLGLFLLATGSLMLLLAPRVIRTTGGTMYYSLILGSLATLLPSMAKQGTSIVAPTMGLVAVVCTIFYLPRTCPKSFTLGEVCVLSHLLAHLVWRIGRWLEGWYFAEMAPTSWFWLIIIWLGLENWFLSEADPNVNNAYLYAFMAMIMIYLALASAVASLVRSDLPLPLFLMLYVVSALAALTVLSKVTEHHPLRWLVLFLFKSKARVLLMPWWFFLLAVTMLLITVYRPPPDSLGSDLPLGRSDNNNVSRGGHLRSESSTAARSSSYTTERLTVKAADTSSRSAEGRLERSFRDPRGSQQTFGNSSRHVRTSQDSPRHARSSQEPPSREQTSQWLGRTGSRTRSGRTIAQRSGILRQPPGRVALGVRKAFHLIAVAAFLPGLIFDPLFLLLASLVAFAGLIVLEVARARQVQVLGPALDSRLQVFAGSQDQGPVLLTHIYLLMGLSLPLWVTYSIADADLKNYAGVLSVGIGDTVACLFGSRFGRNKWPDSDKTVEGTVASVLVQLACVHALQSYGWVNMESMGTVAFALVFSSVYHGVSSQANSLVLPLITMAACF